MKLILIAVMLAAASGMAATITNAQITGFGTVLISGTAEADYICGFPCVGNPSIISVSTAFTGATAGPVRDGFIELFANGGTGGPANNGGSVDGYSFSCREVCFGQDADPRPFTLGVPFDITIFAAASISGSGSAGGSFLQFHFSLFEVGTLPGGVAFPDGLVTVYDAATIPEPTSWLLTGAGLALAVARRRTTLRTSPSQRSRQSHLSRMQMCG